MTPTLRERAEHAAKYGANLVIPAIKIKQLLDELDQAEARLRAVQELHHRWGDTLTGTSICDACDHPVPCPTRALTTAALAEGGEPA